MLVFRVIAYVLILSSSLAAQAAETTILVWCQVGPGHQIYVRGDGGGLTEKESGAKALTESPPGSGEWRINLQADHPIHFKLFFDNRVSMTGGEQTVPVGESTTVAYPLFDFPKGEVSEDQIPGPPKKPSADMRPADPPPLKTVRLYRPAGFKKDAPEPFPLLLGLDAKKLFSQERTDGMNLPQAMDQLIGLGLVSPTVVLGIDNAGGDSERKWEYGTHRTVAQVNGQVVPADGGGGIDDFAEWIKKTVLPYAHANLHANTTDGKVTGIGSSLGGTAVQRAWLRQGIFGKLIPLSSADHWNDQEIPKEIAGLPADHQKVQVYMTHGGQESGNYWDQREIAEGVEASRDAYLNQGYVLGTHIVQLYFDSGTHDEREWAALLRPVLGSRFWREPLGECLEEEWRRVARERRVRLDRGY